MIEVLDFVKLDVRMLQFFERDVEQFVLFDAGFELDPPVVRQIGGKPLEA